MSESDLIKALRERCLMSRWFGLREEMPDGWIMVEDLHAMMKSLIAVVEAAEAIHLKLHETGNDYFLAWEILDKNYADLRAAVLPEGNV